MTKPVSALIIVFAMMLAQNSGGFFPLNGGWGGG